MIILRKDSKLKGSKWIHGLGTLKLIEHRGQLKVIRTNSYNNKLIWRSMSDSHLLDVFLWIGKYLSKKSKLPRDVFLSETAIKQRRIAKDIESILVVNHYNEIK